MVVTAARERGVAPSTRSLLMPLTVCLNVVLLLAFVKVQSLHEDEPSWRRELQDRDRGLTNLVEKDAAITSVGVGFLLGVLGSMSSATGLTLIRASNVLDDPAVSKCRHWRFVWGIFLANGLTSILDTVSLSLAPLSVLAPLGALTVVLSLAVAHTGVLGIKESLTMQQVAPSSLIVFGIAVCTIVGAKPEVDLTMQHLNSSIGKPGFVAFFVTSILCIFGWVTVLTGGRRLGHRCLRLASTRTALMTTLCSGITAGLSAANTKTMMKIVSTWGRAHASGLHPPINTIGVVMAALLLPIFAFLQLYLMNMALSAGRVVLSVPTYMASTIAATMLSGACVFDDMRNMHDRWRISTLAISLIGVVVGIFTLSQQTPNSDGHKDLGELDQREEGMQPVRQDSAILSDTGRLSDVTDIEASLGSPRAQLEVVTLTSTSKMDSSSSAAVLLDNGAVEDDASGLGYGWGQSRGSLMAQGVGELLALKHHACDFALCALAILVALILRQMAYLRHMPMSSYLQASVGAHVSDAAMVAQPEHFRLRDMGFDLFPDRSNSEAYTRAGDTLAALTFFLSTFPLGAAILLRRRPASKPVFIVSILVRWLRLLAAVELLRPAFYLSTSLPAPDIHCVTHNETLWKPTSLQNVLAFSGVMSKSCGDLIFSGRISGSVVGFYMFLHYAETIFGRHLRPLLRLLYVVLIALIAANSYVSITIRHHYTVDVVSAVIITWLVQHKLYSWIGAEDAHPVQLMAARRGCFVLRTAGANEETPSHTSPHARHHQAELDRMAAVAPWKGYLGASLMVACNVFGTYIFLSECTSTVHTY